MINCDTVFISKKNAGVPYGRKAPNSIIMYDFRRTVKTNMQKAGLAAFVGI
jgi:hypothetical protein